MSYLLACYSKLLQVPKGQSLQYGCAGINPVTSEVEHYIDKPDSFVSSDVNGGVYLLSTDIFKVIGSVFHQRHRSNFSSWSE